MKRFLFYVLPLLLIVGCKGSRDVQVLLDRAEMLMAEHPDSAYTILVEIDGATLPNDSELQARYALLYTQAQYKSYHDPENDSLINIAVNFYETKGEEEEIFYAYLYQGIVRYLLNNTAYSSSSFLRAIAHCEDVSDHYAKGQVFSYMAQINSLAHCSDEERYATEALQEYRKLGEDRYIVNAYLNLSVAKMHLSDFRSCFVYIDSCICLATTSGNEDFLTRALSVKANCALLADSFDLSMSIYRKLFSAGSYDFTEIDYSNVAFLFAHKHMSDSARYYLSLSHDRIGNEEELQNYWGRSLWVNSMLKDKDQIIASQDSLLCYQEKLLSEALTQGVIAEQRDYSEKLLLLSQKRNMYKSLLIVILTVILLSVTFLALFFRYRLKVTILRQSEKIMSLQLDKFNNVKKINDGLIALKSDPLIWKYRKLALESKGLTISDWESLNNLFASLMPYFEGSLLELSPLSEIEWHTCMLLKAGFSPGEMAVLMHKSASSISSIRSRLYQKVYKKKGHAGDWDKFIDSI